MAPAKKSSWRDVLSLNARALEYTNHVNPSSAVRIANNKLATKKTLQKAGVQTPRLYALINSRHELRSFRWTKLPPSFVLKPASASGGGGIIVIFGRNKKGNWIKTDKSEIFIPELRNHTFDILDGNFSRGNVPDAAIFEQRIKNHADLKQYSSGGIPDIRVLVYNLVPVMAMLRLPTPESSGRANLHAGGLAVGIDLTYGLTTTAVHRGHSIETLPGSRLKLAGIKIPHWEEILSLASKACDATGLVFAGVDIALDRDDGPHVLELNARPGLSIQLANMTPLRRRLKRIDDLKVASPAKGVRLAKALFGSEIDDDITEISGRPVLKIEEEIQIFDAQNQPHTHKVKVDSGAYRTAIDEALAKEYGIDKPVIDHKSVRGALGKQDRPVVKLKMKVRDREIKTNAFVVDRSHMNYPLIIGRRDLKGFLIDPVKRS